MNSSEELWRQLEDAHLVEGEIPRSESAHSPWYIRAMLGFAGWVGAWFLLGFVGVGLAFVFESKTAALAVGAICCVAAFGIFRAAPKNGFATQFAFAASLAGQVMVGYGLTSFARGADAPGLFWLFALFEAALAICMPNFVHRVWSAFAAVVALSFALTLQGVVNLLPGLLAGALAVLWLNEFDWAARGRLVRSIGYGLALGLLQLDAQLLFGPVGGLWHGRSVEKMWISPWVGPLMAGAVLVWAVSRLLARYNLSLSSRIGASSLAATVVVAAVALRAPGVSASVLLLLLGFANGNRPLFGLGAFAFLTYLSHFYYQLDVTLLLKSGVLAGTGCVLIIAWYAMRMLVPATRKKEEPHA